MSDSEAGPLVRKLERLGYVVSKPPTTPEDFEAEANRVSTLVGPCENEKWLVPPIMPRQLTRLSQGQCSTEEALVVAIRALSRVQLDLLGPRDP